jgi:hypothetical protein
LEISINTQPSSFVGLLGVDQSVLVLKKGNDIEQSQVLKELEKYSELREMKENVAKNYKDFNDAIIITNMKSEYELKKKPLKGGHNHWRRPYNDFDGASFRGGMTPRFGSSYDYNSGFGGSSAMASASSQSFGGDNWMHSIMPMSVGGVNARRFQSQSEDELDSVSLSVPMEKSKTNQRIPQSPPKQPIEVRKVFPETWIFDSVQLLPK